MRACACAALPSPPPKGGRTDLAGESMRVHVGGGRRPAGERISDLQRQVLQLRADMDVLVARSEQTADPSIVAQLQQARGVSIGITWLEGCSPQPVPLLPSPAWTTDASLHEAREGGNVLQTRGAGDTLKGDFSPTPFCTTLIYANSNTANKLDRAQTGLDATRLDTGQRRWRVLSYDLHGFPLVNTARDKTILQHFGTSGP